MAGLPSEGRPQSFLVLSTTNQISIVMSKKRKRSIRRQNGFQWTLQIGGQTIKVSTIGVYSKIHAERGPVAVEDVHVQPSGVHVVLTRGIVRIIASAQQVGGLCDHHRCMVAAVLAPLNIRPTYIGYAVSSHNGHTSASLRLQFGAQMNRTRLSIAEGRAPADAIAYAAARLANEVLATV